MAQQRLTCSTNDVSEAVATVKEKKESWNSAAEHTSDTTLHITAEEREKWDKNTTDIATVEEQAVLNRQTLGYERKNLLKNNASTRTFSGITFTVNDDGSVTVNGTATANAILAISTYQIIPKGDYLCNGCTGGSSSTYYIRYVSAKSAEQTVSDNAQRQYNDDVTVTIDDGYDSIYANIVVLSGTTVDNITLYPMIRRATDTDSTYVPYKESVEERLADLETDTGWIDCISNATADSIAFDESYTQVAKIRRVGKYVSFRGTFKFVSDGTETSDTYVRAFVRSVIPSGCRPSETIYATQFYGVYASSTSSTYTPFSCNVTTDGAITLYMNEGAKITEIYGKVVRVNMDWLMD